ncbi:hypothetical protein Tco_0003634 [Tanacetum coccineum]
MINSISPGSFLPSFLLLLIVVVLILVIVVVMVVGVPLMFFPLSLVTFSHSCSFTLYCLLDQCWDLKDFKDSYYCSVSAAGYKDTTAAELQLLEDLLLSRG